MKLQLLNRVQHIVAKGEIARHDQFLLFKSRLLRRRQKAAVCGKGFHKIYNELNTHSVYKYMSLEYQLSKSVKHLKIIGN